MHGTSMRSLLKEHLLFRTLIACIEIDTLLLAHFEQSLAAQLLVSIAYNIRNTQGSSTWTLTVREDMKLSNINTIEEIVALFKTLWSLATTSHHNVYTNKSIGHTLLDQCYLACKQSLIITAVHKTQHLIAATLQWDMEVRHESTTLCTEVNELICQKIGLHTADTITFNAINTIKSLNKIDKAFAGSLAKVTNIYTSKHYLLATFSCRLFCLCYQRTDCRVARIASCVRYSTVSAIVVAAILHLKEITCTVAT